jgi:mycothiol system anti-sigma-R factor
MSCGRPHEVDCLEILKKVYVYLDGEIDPHGCAEIRQHLDECGPCLQKYGLEQAVKALVARSCGNDPVPSDLRMKVMMRIQQVRVEITPFDRGA